MSSGFTDESARQYVEEMNVPVPSEGVQNIYALHRLTDAPKSSLQNVFDRPYNEVHCLDGRVHDSKRIRVLSETQS